MATIKPDDIPLDKLDAVIERLQKEKNTRIDAAVAAGEAVRVPVSIVGDQDVEYWKARALQDANVPPGKAVHFDITYYKYQDMPDGSPNPMNKMSPLEDGRVIEIRTGVNRSRDLRSGKRAPIWLRQCLLPQAAEAARADCWRAASRLDRDAQTWTKSS